MESENTIKTGGVYHLTCFKDASMKEVLWDETIENSVTNQGLNQLNNEFFYTTAKLAHAWYLELVSTNTAFAAGMTYAVPVYTASTAEGLRQACTFAASSSQIVTNTASPAVFTNGGDSGTPASETIYGVALIGATSGSYTTPGDTTATGGCLFSYGKLTTAQPWISGNVINLTYQVTSATT